MTKKSKPIDQIHDALMLDGDPQNLKDYYARWAKSYDNDLDGNYVGPGFMVQLLVKHQGDLESGAELPSDVCIMDAGCGTGLLGKLLRDEGFGCILLSLI